MNFESESCLGGALYFTGMRENNVVYVDIGLNPDLGATGMKPLRMIEKVVLLSDTEQIHIPLARTWMEHMNTRVKMSP